jgi:SAM-dependent methyltransferase
MSIISDWLEERHGGAVLRYLYDAQPWEKAGFLEARQRLVQDLRNPVLEIGCGPGLNFRHYDGDLEVTAVEPYVDFRNYAIEAAKQVSAKIHVQDGDAQALEYEDDSFGSAVSTLVFCSIPNSSAALRELRRVLRPGAPLRLLEHVRSNNRAVAAIQDIVNPIWRWFDGHGCNVNRDTIGLLIASGISIERVESLEVSVPGQPKLPIREVYARN